MHKKTEKKKETKTLNLSAAYETENEKKKWRFFFSPENKNAFERNLTVESSQLK